MKKTADARSIPEEMGLRVQKTETLHPLDVLLVAALLVSGVAWLWISIAGPEPDLAQALNSSSGRLLAASIGVACVVAVIRLLSIVRWPFSDRDGSVL